MGSMFWMAFDKIHNLKYKKKILKIKMFEMYEIAEVAQQNRWMSQLSKAPTRKNAHKFQQLKLFSFTVTLLINPKN